MYWYQKTLALEIKPFKNWYLGGPGDDGLVPPNYVKRLVSLLSPDIKKSSTLAQAFKKIEFFFVHLEVSGGWYPQIMSKYFCFFKFYW